jgi:hypothetical protein
MIVQTFHNYIDRYEKSEGIDLFVQACQFFIDTGMEEKEGIIHDLEIIRDSCPFPDCLMICEGIKKIKEHE